MFFFPALPFIDSTIDIATFSFIAGLLLLSFFSICFIFHLRIKSRNSRFLQNFNSLWTVRFLLVVFITFWALTELLRIPLFRKQYFYPLLPELTIAQEANLCNFHIVLSLGFFEPGFLVTLLFLLDVSVKKTTHRNFFSVFFVFTLCVPIFLLQAYSVFFPGSEMRLPEYFYRTWFVHMNSPDHEILCAYPLSSTILFGIFGVVFTLSFLFSFWNVVSHVINKALRVRIFVLGLTVMSVLPLQILSMGLSVIWTRDKTAFGAIALLVFFSPFTCAVVGEGILVIKPIADSLAAEVGGRAEAGEGTCQGSNHGPRSTRSPPMEDGVAIM